MRRLIFTAILMSVFLYCNQGFGEGSCDICSSKSSDVEKDIILHCLVGHMRMYPEDPKGAKQAVICAIAEWQRRDGAIGFTISDAFLAMMEMNPTVFFAVMAENEKSFSEWVNELEPLSFTWHKEPPSPLEGKRKKLIEFLSKVGPLKEEQDILRQRLLSALKALKVRQVQ